MKNLILASILLLNAAFFALAEKKADHEITISGNDTMQFDVKNFDVTAGNKVKIIFKNTGKLPKIAMGHNLVLLKKGVTAIAFGQKALGAGANAVNPLPDSLKGDVIANTKLLGPGEEEIVSFTAPTEKGAYEYVCTFPGHFAMMRGTMTVK
jgi:azurin